MSLVAAGDVQLEAHLRLAMMNFTAPFTVETTALVTDGLVQGGALTRSLPQHAGKLAIQLVSRSPRYYWHALWVDGEVWTWGEVLGTNVPARPALQTMAKWANKIGIKARWGKPQPIVREKPWLLPNIDPDAAK